LKAAGRVGSWQVPPRRHPCARGEIITGGWATPSGVWAESWRCGYNPLDRQSFPRLVL
jgi:hypothetical protein